MLISFTIQCLISDDLFNIEGCELYPLSDDKDKNYDYTTETGVFDVRKTLSENINSKYIIISYSNCNLIYVSFRISNHICRTDFQ